MQLLNKKSILILTLIVWGFLFFRLNNSEETRSQKVTQSLINDLNNPKMITPKNQPVVERNTSNKSDFTSSQQSITNCTDINSDKINSLNDLGQLLKLQSPLPKDIIRHNFIFEKNWEEHRISIYPSEDGGTWNIDEFTTDHEGLPIPGKKSKTKNYLQSVEKIKSNLTETNKLFDEIDFKFSYLNLKGTGLLVDGRLESLTLINKKSKRSLDCRDQVCNCY